MSDNAYPEQKVRHWLGVVAQQMTRESQSVLTLENRQPSWLPSVAWRRSFVVASRLFEVTFFSLLALAGLSLVLYFNDLAVERYHADKESRGASAAAHKDHDSELNQSEFREWMYSVPLLGLILCLLYDRSRSPQRLLVAVVLLLVSLVAVEQLVAWLAPDQALLKGTLMVFAAIGGLWLASKCTQDFDRAIRTAESVRWGFATGLRGGSVGAVLGLLICLPLVIRQRDALTEAAQQVRSMTGIEHLLSIEGGIVLLILGSLVTLVILGIFDRLAPLLNGVLLAFLVAFALASEIFILPLGAAIAGLVLSRKSAEVEAKERPNQGIYLSLTQGTKALLSSLLIFFVAIGAYLEFLHSHELQDRVKSLLSWLTGFEGDVAVGAGAKQIFATIFAFALPCASVAAFFWYGGLAWSRQLVLRVMLGLSGSCPFFFNRFLSYVVDELGFMHRVGGSYLFEHRHLLEHFAKQREKPASAPATPGAVRSRPAAQA